MCFSATASFGAGIVLSAIGIASVKRAETPSSIAFASIPLLFAIQQTTEGFLWVALANPAYASLQQPTTYVYLFFAQVIWPLWLPLSVLLLEKKKSKIIMEKLLLMVGIIVSSYLAFCLFTYPVEAKITGYHIAYLQDYPAALGWSVGLLYIVATITPALISGIPKMWLFGTTILISYIMTKIFYEDYVVSVWCFFASAISLWVFIILNEKKNLNKRLLVPGHTGL